MSKSTPDHCENCLHVGAQRCIFSAASDLIDWQPGMDHATLPERLKLDGKITCKSIPSNGLYACCAPARSDCCGQELQASVCLAEGCIGSMRLVQVSCILEAGSHSSWGPPLCSLMKSKKRCLGKSNWELSGAMCVLHSICKLECPMCIKLVQSRPKLLEQMELFICSRCMGKSLSAVARSLETR